MHTNNYFKAKNHVFFFVDSIPESIETAYTMASLVGPVSVYRPVVHEGPWDRCGIIGHRNRQAIVQDLSLETNAEERDRLVDEMSALHRVYEDVGRPVPLVQVAA